MKVADRDFDRKVTDTRDDVKVLRGLVFAMAVSVAMWAGMVGVVQSLLN